jgi:hypothetical protein
MAFENKEILFAALQICENDVSVHDSCMDLSGFPLDYIFKVNNNLDYLDKALPKLYDYHIRLRREATYGVNQASISFGGPVESGMSANIKWFINFSLSLGSLFEKYDFLNHLPKDEITDEYLNSHFDTKDKVWHHNAVTAMKYLSRRDYNKKYSWSDKADKAISYYDKCWLPALNFLGSGVSMNEDTPRDFLEPWMQMCFLFDRVDQHEDIF